MKRNFSIFSCSSQVFLSVLTLCAILFILTIGCDRNKSTRPESTENETTKPFATGRLRIQQEEQRKQDSRKAAQSKPATAKPLANVSNDPAALSAIYPIAADWLDFYDAQGVASPILDVYVRAPRSGFVKSVDYIPGEKIRQNDPVVTLVLETSDKNGAIEEVPVLAPISGLTIQQNVQPGDWVSEGDSILARIVRIDYLIISFSLPADEAKQLYSRYNRLEQIRLEELAIKERSESGTEGLAKSSVELPLVALISDKADRPADARSFWEQAQIAAIDYVGINLDPETQTAQIRAVIPNPTLKFLPGEKIALRIPGAIVEKTLLVAPEGIQKSLEDTFVYTIDQNKEPKVDQNFVELSPTEFGMRRVKSGLSSTDLYLLASQTELQEKPEFVVDILAPDHFSAWKQYNLQFSDFVNYLINNSPAVNNIIEQARLIQTGKLDLPAAVLPEEQKKPEIEKANAPEGPKNQTSESVPTEPVKAIPTESAPTESAPEKPKPTNPLPAGTSSILSPDPGSSTSVPTKTLPQSPSERKTLSAVPSDDKTNQLASPSQPIGRRLLPKATPAPTSTQTGKTDSLSYSAPITLPNAPSLPIRDPVTGLLLTLPDGYYPLRYWNRQP